MEVWVCNERMKIGPFYETPDGRIVKTNGWSSLGKKVRYYENDGLGEKMIYQDEVSGWKIREDLEDFPDAKNKLLPHQFKEDFGLTRESDLSIALYNKPSFDFSEIEKLEKMVKDYYSAVEAASTDSLDEDIDGSFDGTLGASPIMPKISKKRSTAPRRSMVG